MDEWFVKLWNRCVPIGTSVQVVKDGVRIEKTQTTSEAWMVGAHSPLVRLDGISGGFHLRRVLPDCGAVAYRMATELLAHPTNPDLAIDSVWPSMDDSGKDRDPLWGIALHVDGGDVPSFLRVFDFDELLKHELESCGDHAGSKEVAAMRNLAENMRRSLRRLEKWLAIDEHVGYTALAAYFANKLDDEQKKERSTTIWLIVVAVPLSRDACVELKRGE